MEVAGRLATCWYRRWTCSKCGVELVSEQVPEVDHGAGVAGCRPIDYTFVKPSGDWASDEPRILSYFSSFAGCCTHYVEDNHLANGCLVRVASITCLIASTVT
jgi:hypothetical protein